MNLRDPFYAELMWLPPISFYAFWLRQKSSYIIEGYENYQKRSYRNKIYLGSAQGIQLLSIPLEKGKHQKKPIREVKISYQEDWVNNHLRSIANNYRSAAFFEFYFEELEALYLQKEESLWDWNLNFLKWSIEKLQSSALEYNFTKVFKKSYPSIDLRNQVKSIQKIVPLEANPQFWYPQIFEEQSGFINDLSILDLIMNTGPEACLYLKQYWKD